MTAAAILIFDTSIYPRQTTGWLTTARWLSAYMSSRVLATTTDSSLMTFLKLNLCYFSTPSSEFPSIMRKLQISTN